MTERTDAEGERDDPTQPHAHWVPVGTYPTGLAADMARQLLDEQGIPVLAQSDAAGIFGLGFQGAVTGGVTLHVPSPEVERARQLLEPDESP